MIRRLRPLLLLLFVATARAQDEDALARLCMQQASASNEPAALAAACAAYAEQRAADPLAGVARSLAAWNDLRAGQREEATAIWTLQAVPGTNALEQGLDRVARAWLTRLDRERVKAALQFFYRKEVRYPFSLLELRSDARLPREMLPPERDRWDEAWRYRLVGFKSMPGLEDQKYELLAARLGADSDLAAALAVPYGARIDLKPVRMRTVAVAGREVVEFARGEPARTVLLTAGLEAEGLLLAYVGPRLLLVCDALHWKAFPRPPGP